MSVTAHDKWFRYHMPYVFERLDRLVWLPLNRNYKPLGQLTTEHVNYEDYRDKAIRFSRDPKKITGVFYPSSAREDLLYMYDDGAASRKTYFDRLEKLMSVYAKTSVKIGIRV